jgi:hypothetical protein
MGSSFGYATATECVRTFLDRCRPHEWQPFHLLSDLYMLQKQKVLTGRYSNSDKKQRQFSACFHNSSRVPD